LQFDLTKLEEEKRFRFMNLSTVKEEGIPEILSTIIDEVSSNKVSRLVIDSFTAMAQAFREPIDARVVVYTLLDKIVRQLGCTTLLIVETPIGEQKIGMGVEEFVADGIIILESFVDHLEIKRRALIRKMRGTNQSLKYHNIVISKDGIRLTPMV
jgi:circadian clock protein KaiC